MKTMKNNRVGFLASRKALALSKTLVSSKFLGGGGGILCLALVGALAFGAALTANATEQQWIYNSTDSTLTDSEGLWTFNATLNTETAVLTISSVKACTLPTDATVDANRLVDLSSPLNVTVGESQTEIKSVALGYQLFNYTKTGSGRIREFRCDILSSLGKECFYKNEGITNVVIGGSATTMPQSFLNECKNLQTATLNFPDLRVIEQNPLVNCSKLKYIDIATLVPPGVTNISSWYACQNAPMSGDLTLTNIVILAGGVFKNVSIKNVYLAGTIESLQKEVFSANSNGTITNIVLDLPNLKSVDMTANATAFKNQKAIRRVELVRPISNMGQLTNIVAYADNGSIGALRIYVSKNQWTPTTDETYDADSNKTGFFSEITEEEKAALDAEIRSKVIGVLVKGGARKGVFVHKRSKYELSPGLILIIR